MHRIDTDSAQIQNLSTEFYDLLMGEIEPDLTTALLPLLPEMYADETPQEHAKRMIRYEKAFNAFDERSMVVMAEIAGKVRKHQHTALQNKEDADRHGELAVMQHISADFS